MSELQTIAMTELETVNGGGDLWDAVEGAVSIVTSPVTSTIRGVRATVGALQQGHTVTDSLANGLVQAAGTMNAPNLATIPANPNAPRPPARRPGQ